MPIGPIIRGLFGRHEHAIAAFYRGIFVDIDAFVDQICEWVPNPKHILEVGCGEGAVTERLTARYPDAQVHAIDVTPRVGRLFRGDATRVRFAQRTVQEVAREHPGAFDLVILSDVIHHVPEALRASILEAIREALAPQGRFLFKDWAKTSRPIHWLCHAGDRWVTGDRVRYVDHQEAVNLVETAFPHGKITREAWVRPWPNNFLMLVEA